MPVVFATTLTVVFVPAVNEPDVAESERNEGVPLPSDADQLSELPPVFATTMGCEETPPDPWIEIAPGVADSTGEAETVKLTPTTWGLPAVAAPASLPVSVMEPVYDPATNDAADTLTLKLVLPPVATEALAGDTESHPRPLESEIEGVIVTGPAQEPPTLREKVWLPAFCPDSAV
jgi:hypothetical protein